MHSYSNRLLPFDILLWMTLFEWEFDCRHKIVLITTSLSFVLLQCFCTALNGNVEETCKHWMHDHLHNVSEQHRGFWAFWPHLFAFKWEHTFLWRNIGLPTGDSVVSLCSVNSLLCSWLMYTFDCTVYLPLDLSKTGTVVPELANVCYWCLKYVT